VFDAHDALFQETLSRVELGPKALLITRGIADRLRRPGRAAEDTRLLLTRLNPDKTPGSIERCPILYHI